MSRPPPSRARFAGLTAAALATASGLVSAYWAAGGRALLDTVGAGPIADADGATAALVPAVAALVKLAAACLAVGLVVTAETPRGVRLLSAAGALLLTAYGGVLTVAGAVALTGAFGTVDADSERALLWHVALWDPWFLLWGSTWGLAWWWTRPAAAR